MAHNMLHRATTWAGTNLKPRGYTGALMDAGYLGWGDILGGIGRGLLDYGDQERAASAWRPLNAPVPPAASIGKSIDVFKAGLAGAVQQRMVLQNLRSSAALRQALLGPGTGVSPAAPGTTAVAPPRVSAPPMPTVPIGQVQAGGGQAFPSAVKLAPLRLPGSLREQAVAPSAVVSTMQQRQPPSGKFEDLPPHVRLAMSEALRATPNDTTGAMKIYSDYWDAEQKLYRDPADPWAVVQVSPGRYAKMNKETSEIRQFTAAESGIESGQAGMWRGTRGHTQARNDLFRLAPQIEAGPISASNRNGYTPTDLQEYKYAWNTASREHYEPITLGDGSIEWQKFEGDSPFETGLIPPPGWSEDEARGTDAVGLPTAAPKPPAKAATDAIGFYDRMRPSIERAEAIENTPGFSMDLSTILTLNGDGKTKLGTILATMKRSTLSDDMQEYFVHLHNFTTAFLRKESGAAITPDEMHLGVTLYFPMPGERGQARAAKVKARRLLTNAMWKTGIPARQYYDFLEEAGEPVGMPPMSDVVKELQALEPVLTVPFTSSDGTVIQVLPQNGVEVAPVPHLLEVE